MKIVLVLRTPFFLKNFAAAIKELLEREHTVHVVFSEPLVGRPGEDLIQKNEKFLPGVQMEVITSPSGLRRKLATTISSTLDVIRYDEPIYDSSLKLRRRARNKVGRGIIMTVFMTIARTASHIIGIKKVKYFLLRWLDHVPAPQKLVAWLKNQKPDLLLVSPLTPIGSDQSTWVLAAREATTRVGYAMYSWDNLSNKGLIRPLPDAALVWNEIHKDEAVTLHGMSAEKIYITGSPGYDIWFEANRESLRKDFCNRVGLDENGPYLLYVCSSVFVGGKGEVEIFKKLLKILRSSQNPHVSNLGVLIRPHPQFNENWIKEDFSQYENVVVYPKKTAIPFSGGEKADFRDSIFHSIGVMGINTSAMVEAAIMNKPVFTMEDPCCDDTQSGTLHFRHLLKYGFLIRSDSLYGCVHKIESILQKDSELLKSSKVNSKRFVEEYIRPQGRNLAAACAWADAVEKIISTPKQDNPKKLKYKILASAGMISCFLLSCLQSNLAYQANKKEKNGPKLPKKKRQNKSNLPTQRLSFQLKRRVLDWLTNEPPRVKDVAVLKGPYKVLQTLHDSYATISSDQKPPPLLVLGDSVHYRISRDDIDKRSLSEMISQICQQNNDSALCINYSAYHPCVYQAILRALTRMPYHPAKVVLPINLRCFSPQWHFHPDHIFTSEIEILEEYSSGKKIPEVVRLANTEAVEKYEAKDVQYEDTPLNQIGQFRLVSKAESRTEYQEQWKARQIAIFHYLHKLVLDHPILRSAVEMVRTANSAGIKPIVYLTPINFLHGTRVVGSRFAEQVGANRKIIKCALEDEILAANGRYYDWSCDFTDDFFFYPGERTEHLNQNGRLKLATRIRDAVQSCN